MASAPNPPPVATSAAQSAPAQTEHRIAIAFSGGIALAVYESGVAIELLKLVYGEDSYHKLHEKLGTIVVDIITGTSAGGLNGALLGAALANRANLNGLADLWIEQGDFGRLLYTHKEKEPYSYLNGEWFLGKILATLERMMSERRSEAPYPYLDLFITATNLDGDEFQVQVDDETSMPVRTYRQVLHFRYRAEDPLDPGRNDFLTSEDRKRLAIAARASASFPVAFAPVMLSKTEFAPDAESDTRIARYLHATACHIDGGVLDNRPIDLAVGAIAKRRADKRVKRHLFFVEPDPEDLLAPTDQANCRRSPLEVAVKGLLTLPTYQSLAAALEELQAHNHSVKERRAVLDFYDRVLAQDRRGRSHDIAKDVLASGVEFSRGAAGDRRSLWYRAFEDAYLLLRLKRFALYRANGAPLSRSVAELFQHFDSLLPPAPGETGDLSYKAKRLLLDRGDLKFYQRLYRYLAELIRELTENPNLETSVLAGLNRIKAAFYDLEVRIQMRERAQETGSRPEAITAIEQRFEAIIAEVGTKPTEESVKAAAAKLVEDLEASDFLGKNWHFLEDVRSEAFNTLHSNFRQLLESGPAKVNGALAAMLTDGYWKIRDALDSFCLRDMLLYPLTTDSDFAMELEQVSFSRISPADASIPVPDMNIPGDRSPHQKLAGELLAHFGGFLKREWRRNDVVWGRLDSAEVLIRRLTHEAVACGTLTQDEVKTWILERKREIIAEAGKGSIHSPPDSEDLIGEETLASVPPADKFQWVARMISITNRMLARVEAPSVLPALLGPLKAARSSLRAASIVLWIVSLLYRSTFRKIAIAILVVALIVALYLLWDHSIKDVLHAVGKRLIAIDGA